MKKISFRPERLKPQKRGRFFVDGIHGHFIYSRHAKKALRLASDRMVEWALRSGFDATDRFVDYLKYLRVKGLYHG